MATRRQNIKDIENKQARARDEYAKNKNQLSEYRVKEKAADQVYSSKISARKKRGKRIV